MELIPYIKRVAVGPRGSKDLTREEARQANNLILDGKAHPVEFGAFTMAIRVKGEANSELIGAVDAFHDHCDPAADWAIENLVTVASPFDGKDRLMVWTPAATLLAAHCGARVLVLTDRDVPPKKGVTPSMIFEGLGYPLATTFSQAAAQIRERGWSCLELSRAIPVMETLKEWRQLLGKRPYLSTCEKLVNPARGPLITGVFHGPVFRQMEAVVRDLDYPRTLVVQGTQGSMELKSTAPSNVCLIEKGAESITSTIDPGDYGLRNEEEIPLPSTLAECVHKTRNVFSGIEVEARNATVLNAGMLLWIGGQKPTLAEAIAMADRHFGSVSLA